MSRRYIRASARKLQALQERRLEQYEFVALVLDGKTFQDDTLVVALGITVQGEKVLLGFVETGTENETACAEFLQGLVKRGLRDEDGLLIVMDGGKGLRAGARRVFGTDTPVQRCQWHKRENVAAYVPQGATGAVARQAPAGVRTADLCGSQSSPRGRPARAQAAQ